MEPGCFYHVYNRGNNRENIVCEEENYRFFLRRYKRYVLRYVDTYAYCLMPNHFHFLVRVKDTVLGSAEREEGKLTPLEQAFRDFFISYAKSFNQRYHRTGSLFQYKFKRKPVKDEAHLMCLVVYIHENPVEAKLCTRLRDWVYSSYRAIISKSKKPTSVLRDDVLAWFGGRRGFILAHQQGLNDEGYKSIAPYLE